MNCPSCSTVLNITERRGIEIDFCPKCRGVWLDRGELDKLLQGSDGGRGYSDDHQRERGYSERKEYSKKHYKKSLLSELFDF
jgi:Zn-finger nucleic acid-binding protein